MAVTQRMTPDGLAAVIHRYPTQVEPIQRVAVQAAPRSSACGGAITSRKQTSLRRSLRQRHVCGRHSGVFNCAIPSSGRGSRVGRQVLGAEVGTPMQAGKDFRRLILHGFQECQHYLIGRKILILVAVHNENNQGDRCDPAHLYQSRPSIGPGRRQSRVEAGAKMKRRILIAGPPCDTKPRYPSRWPSHRMA